MRQGIGKFALRAMVALPLLAGASQAEAQFYETQRGPGQYDVQSLNYDRWCRETQLYPAERCDARMADDIAAFEAHRAVIERYELQYLMERKREAEASARADRSYTPPWVLYDDPFGR